jgi:uncharacterized membrane protein YjgN (DUF898 family)
MRWKNPFDAPPPIARQPLPGEDPAFAMEEGVPPEFDPNAPLADQPKGETVLLTCTAQWREYFSIWVVCQAMTLLTFGLYASFARTRKARYIARNMQLNSLPFDVQLNPMALLKGRLLALAIVVVAIGIALIYPMTRPFLVIAAFATLPWLLSRTIAFRWWRTSFAGRAFGFTPQAKPLRKSAWIVGLFTALAVVPITAAEQMRLSPWVFATLIGTMGAAILATYLTTAVLHTRFANARYGKHAVRLDTTPWEMYKKLFNGVRSGVGFAIAIAMGFQFLAMALSFNGFPDFGAVLNAFSLLAITVLGVSAARAQRFNFAMNRLTVGEHLRFESTLDPGKTARKSTLYALINVFSLGLTVPWTTVQMLHWRCEHIRVHITQPWSEFIDTGDAQAEKAGGATSDGLAEQFDFELTL